MLRICKECEVHHYENCENCSGFGVYTVVRHPGKTFPVLSGDTHQGKVGKWRPCPECGSIPAGLPGEVITSMS